MAQKNNKNRAKKMAKRKAKSKIKQKNETLIKNRVKGLAMSGSVHESFIQYDDGLMTIFLARKKESLYTVSVILVDLYCLGAKNAFLSQVDEMQYHEMRTRKTDDISPEQAKKVILDSVEYADNLGFKAHKNFKKAIKAYDDIDEDKECEFEFGKNGKPYFFAGPFDSPEISQKIINTLEKSCGKDNYSCVMPFGMDFDENEGRYEGSENF